jgi:hypothetical protein
MAETPAKAVVFSRDMKSLPKLRLFRRNRLQSEFAQTIALSSMVFARVSFISLTNDFSLP